MRRHAASLQIKLKIKKLKPDKEVRTTKEREGGDNRLAYINRPIRQAVGVAQRKEEATRQRGSRRKMPGQSTNWEVSGDGRASPGWST